MDAAFVRVAVTPHRELFEDEERQDPDQQREQDAAGIKRGKRLRQQLEQRNAEERSYGVADQPRHHAIAERIRHQQQAGRDDQPAESAEKAETDRRSGQRHATSYCGLRIADCRRA